VVATDRHGRFYISSLGRDGPGQLFVTLNRSIDGGRHFGPAVPVATAPRPDKSWLAIGPDPQQRERDNLYLTWTEIDLSTGATVLRFARSTDDGTTFAVRTIFAPPPEPVQANPKNAIQFSTPVVDPATGKLYVALLQFGNVAQDYLVMMVSIDRRSATTPAPPLRPARRTRVRTSALLRPPSSRPGSRRTTC
jgi:hypothetical protein